MSSGKFLVMGVLPLHDNRGDSTHFRELIDSYRAEGVDCAVLCAPSVHCGSELDEFVVSGRSDRFRLQLLWNTVGVLKGAAIVISRGVDLIYSRMDVGVFTAVLIKLVTNRPLIVELNGLPVVDLKLYRPNGWFLIKVAKFWEYINYNLCDAVVGAPGYVRYVQCHNAVSVGKSLVRSLGVNRSVFFERTREACREYLALPDVPYICWTGTMSGIQGLSYLIEAMRVYVTCIKGQGVLLLIGDGPLKEVCEKLVVSYKLQNSVKFVGRVDYATVSWWIGASTVCVGSFPGNRGDRGTVSALKMKTYLACGRPVVTTEMDELADMISGSGAGLSVPADDALAMANAIDVVLSEDAERWSKRSRAASASVGEDGDWRGRIEGLLRQMKSLWRENIV